MATNDKQTKLGAIMQQILDENICPDLAKTATQLVFGDGNPDSELVFIGEAPGKNEDVQGKPFVGAAGKFLNEMLEMIGLKREDIYITNIVKYRPPNNRDPLPGEKEAFMPFLMAQLEAIKPKMVITLGRHSLNCFLPNLSISQVHGQPKRMRVKIKEFGDWKNLSGGKDANGMQGDSENRANGTDSTESETRKQSTPQSVAKLASVTDKVSKQSELVLVILPLFHPAAALYNGGMRQTLIDDFTRIPTIVAKI